MCMCSLPVDAEQYESFGSLWADMYHYDKRVVKDSASVGLASNNVLDIGRKGTLSFHGDVTARIDKIYAQDPQGDKITTDLEVNQVYVEKKLSGDLFLTVGKKRVLWGVGLARNPIDFINSHKTSFDPEQTKIGTDCAVLDYYQANNALSMLITAPDDLSYAGFGTKFSMFSVGPNADLHVVGYYDKKTRMNLGCAVDATPFKESFLLSNVAVYGELAFSQESVLGNKKRNFYWKFLGGIRYLIPDTETFFAAEYFFAQDGYDDFVNPAAVPWDRIDIEYAAKHNIIITLNHPRISNACAFTDTLGLTATWIYNPLDKSRSLITRLESTFFTNWLITAEVALFSGNEKTQYGLYHLNHYLRLKIEFYWQKFWNS